MNEEIKVAAEEAARFVRRAGATVSAELVDQLHADVRQLASAYLRRPPFHMFQPLAALRAEVFGILDRHPRLEFLRDLYSVGGQVSAMLAHASSDLGHPFAADSHARTAWICADLAGDRQLGAYTRWIQSNIAYWTGDHRLAILIAQTGRDVADHADDHIRLASQEARAHAAQGDESGTNDALATVATFRDRLPADRAASTLGVFHFGAGKAAYYSSEARLALGGSGNVRLAIRDAQDSIQLIAASADHDGSTELAAAARLDLALALLADNDLEAAAHEIGTVLDIPAESRTVLIIGRVRSIQTELARSYSGITAAEEIREQTQLFRAYPAARELPLVADTGAP